MSSRWARYGEARAYMAGGAVALLLVLWAGLAVKDAVQKDVPEQAQSSAGGTLTTNREARQVVPHTRTRGS